MDTERFDGLSLGYKDHDALAGIEGLPLVLKRLMTRRR
jgi:hypothetical protein